MIKEFTNKDKMLARKYIQAGYNYVVRESDGILYITKEKPEKNWITDTWVIYKDDKRVDKRNLKPIQPGSEPTALSDIINT